MRRSSGGLLLAFALLPAMTRAQQAQQNFPARHEIVRGRVQSDSGLAVRGADVIVTKISDRTARTASTDARGDYAIDGPTATGLLSGRFRDGLPAIHGTPHAHDERLRHHGERDAARRRAALAAGGLASDAPRARSRSVVVRRGRYRGSGGSAERSAAIGPGLGGRSDGDRGNGSRVSRSRRLVFRSPVSRRRKMPSRSAVSLSPAPTSRAMRRAAFAFKHRPMIHRTAGSAARKRRSISRSATSSRRARRI